MHTDTSRSYIPTDPDEVSIPLSGWFDILIHPRRATERITYVYGGLTAPALVILCAVTTGLWISSLAPALTYLFPMEPGIVPLGIAASGMGVGMVVLAATIGGVLSLYISSGILTLIGKLLGGSGSYDDVLLGLALSTVPITLATALLAAINWLTRTLGGNDPDLLLGLFWVSVAGVIAAALYRYAVLVFGLSGVHRYSAWRSLATLLVMWAIYLAVDIVRVAIGSGLG